jgi:hypothetical protein
MTVIGSALAVLLAAATTSCGGLVAGSAFSEPMDASADGAVVDTGTSDGVERACDTDSDCATMTATFGKYLCAYRTEHPSPLNCTSQTRTCIFVSTGGRGVYFAPECGCDGGNVVIDPTWPAAPSPVTSLGPCTVAAPRDAATE